MPFRAFIAADLEVGPALEPLVRELGDADRRLKVVSTSQLHLTLKFLGETEDDLVRDIVEAMRRASVDVGTAHLRLRGMGAFPSFSRIRVIWVAVEGADGLAAIARRLDELVGPLGFPRETRPWAAHLTLARARDDRGLGRVRAVLQSHADETFAETRVDEIRLKKSVLTPDGPVYSTVDAIRLGREEP